MLKNILISFLLLFPTSSFAHECSEQIDHLSREYGIPIYCKIGSFGFMSDDIAGEQGSRNMIEGSYKALNKFFVTYGKSFLKRNLTEVVLLKNLKYFGNDVGGLSDGDKIYLCLDDYSEYNGYREHIYFKNMNHEFSSSILKKVPFYKRVLWKKISYIYDFSRKYLVKCLNDTDFAKNSSEYLLENGILSNYGLTNDENDFNVYAEKLFTRDYLLLNAKKTYPKVKQKLEMVKEMYRNLGFTGNFPDET